MVKHELVVEMAEDLGVEESRTSELRSLLNRFLMILMKESGSLDLVHLSRRRGHHRCSWRRLRPSWRLISQVKLVS